MKHETWEIPADKQRTNAEQTMGDFKFTIKLFWEFFIGPFKRALMPLTKAADPNKIPVIIVPGFICRPAIYADMQRKIQAAGYPCHVLSLGYQVSNVLGKGRKLSAYLDEQGIDEAYVVAHSMGGLVVTSAILQGEKRIRHGWTLGSPLWGTNVVWVLYAIAALLFVCNQASGWNWGLLLLALYLSPSLRQMMPKSDYLEFTSKEYPKMDNLTSVFCAMDTVVFSAPWNEPGSTSRFGRPTDILFPESGHNNIAMGENAIEALVKAIEIKNGTDPAEAAVADSKTD
ncbi:MAG: pimeloyl-ACP methyl ester carboxylesterase [Gammaproteobacteria bacterium]|jgi:pimeloyl-ACP methyl ester carboxylesterase